MSTQGELAGKVAIVTGGAGGLGAAMVARFAQQGASVVIADLNADKGDALANQIGANTIFQRCDVSSADEVQALINRAVTDFGGLHIMVNNAGVGGSIKTFLEDDLADFNTIMGVNLFGVMVGTQRASRHMAEHGGGTVINITSIGGINAGSGVMAYRASKAGVIHFSRSAAVDLAQYNIRINCIAPAHIATAMNAAFDQSVIVRLMQPLQRMASPDDVAEAALFLASDRSAQITGIVMPVDGGATAGSPPRARKELRK